MGDRMRLTHLFVLTLTLTTLLRAAPADAQPTVEKAPVRVVFGEPRVWGDIDRAVVLQALRRRHGALAACYRRWSPTRAPATVPLLFLVTDRGARGPEGVGGVRGCIYRSMRAWSFPRPTCAPARVEVTVWFAVRG